MGFRRNLRSKAAGFDISDRIDLYYQGGDEIAQVFTAHGAYIQQEVLALRAVRGPAPAGAYAEAHKVDGLQVALGVRKVT